MNLLKQSENSGMYGNKNTKGWETYETKKDNIEFGGRFQFPVPRAEIGLSYHHRKAVETVYFDITYPAERELIFPENKFGIDIKADLGVGLWIENVLKHHESQHHYPFTNMFTLGIDYTFGIGNGVRLMTEHLIYQYSTELFINDITSHFTAFSANYPLSIFASLSFISFYNWTDNNSYNFINLGLNFDKFSYYIMGFINPTEFSIFNFETGPTLFNGTGFQIMAVYNY